MEKGKQASLSKEKLVETATHKAATRIERSLSRTTLTSHPMKHSRENPAIIRKYETRLGAISQVLLSAFALLSILQAPSAYYDITVPPTDVLFDYIIFLITIGAIAFALFLVFALLLIIPMKRMGASPRSSKLSTIGLLFGFITATIGMMYILFWPIVFPIAFSRAYQYIYYDATILGAMSLSIAGPFIGLTMGLIGAFPVLHRRSFQSDGFWATVGVTYIIAGLLAGCSVPAFFISAITGLYVAVATSLVMLIGGTIGTIGFLVRGKPWEGK